MSRRELVAAGEQSPPLSLLFHFALSLPAVVDDFAQGAATGLS
jgi:hypothetical protein